MCFFGTGSLFSSCSLCKRFETMHILDIKPIGAIRTPENLKNGWMGTLENAVNCPKNRSASGSVSSRALASEDAAGG
jgi:hypothetical protein